MQLDSKAQALDWAPPLEGQDATAAVEWLLQFATRHQASDVHLHMDREGCRVQFRLDGVLTHVGTLPTEAAKLILGRVKYLAKLKTYVESHCHRTAGLPPTRWVWPAMFASPPTRL